MVSTIAIVIACIVVTALVVMKFIIIPATETPSGSESVPTPTTPQPSVPQPSVPQPSVPQPPSQPPTPTVWTTYSPIIPSALVSSIPPSAIKVILEKDIHYYTDAAIGPTSGTADVHYLGKFTNADEVALAAVKAGFKYFTWHNLTFEGDWKGAAHASNKSPWIKADATGRVSGYVRQ